jgi:hypothetical protein
MIFYLKENKNFKTLLVLASLFIDKIKIEDHAKVLWKKKWIFIFLELFGFFNDD